MMLKQEIQEMIELMFYPDDYEELQSLPIVNYESGMYIFFEHDIITNVNLMNIKTRCNMAYKLALRILDDNYEQIKESIVAEHESIELMQSELNKRQIPRTVDELMRESFRRENSFNEYFVKN